MGYYTKYDISPQFGEGVPDWSEFLNVVTEISGYADPFEDSCNWYDHEEDMLKISARFPEVEWVLDGEGEESGDIWRKTFKNGAMLSNKKAKIVFD